MRLLNYHNDSSLLSMCLIFVMPQIFLYRLEGHVNILRVLLLNDRHLRPMIYNQFVFKLSELLSSVTTCY